MDRLVPATLAVILAVVGAGFADEFVENTPDQNQLITAAVGRVDSLLPGMTPEAIQRAKERVVAIEAAIRARHESLLDERSVRGRDLEAEWRSRWSLPAQDHVRCEPGNPGTHTEPAPPEDADVFGRDFTQLSPGRDRIEDSPIAEPIPATRAIAAVATEPPLLAEERDLLIADGIALFGRALQEASQSYNLRPGFLLCVMRIESAFDPTAVSHAGAIGLMQLMPTTAEELGANPYDLTENINGGARLIASHLDHYSGDVALAMAAYNAGPGAVERYRGVPPYPETQNYVARILQNCGDPRP